MPRAGGEKRGNTKNRRARKLWMLKTFGDGTKAPCAHCATMLDYDTIQSDRIEAGGSYRRENIQPACGNCNKKRSNKADWTYNG